MGIRWPTCSESAEGSKPLYPLMVRPVASRSWSPGVAACRIPRHSRSSSSVSSPAPPAPERGAVIGTSQPRGRDRRGSGPIGSNGNPSASWYRHGRNADQPLPEAAPSSIARQAPPAWQRRRQVRGGRPPADPVHHDRPPRPRRRDGRGRRVLVPGPGSARSQAGPRGDQLRPADRRLRPDRSGAARATRI